MTAFGDEEEEEEEEEQEEEEDREKFSSRFFVLGDPKTGFE